MYAIRSYYVIEQYKQEYYMLLDELSELDKGTREYNRKVDEINDLVSIILRDFPEIEPYIQKIDD